MKIFIVLKSLDPIYDPIYVMRVKEYRSRCGCGCGLGTVLVFVMVFVVVFVMVFGVVLLFLVLAAPVLVLLVVCSMFSVRLGSLVLGSSLLELAKLGDGA
jgi:hypothetical protein